jgi:hypothetical protein
MIPAEHVALSRPEPVAAQTLRGANEPRMLRFLLATSVRRLKAARALEESRKIVYPETTCIVRDVERLTRRLNEVRAADAPAPKAMAEAVSVPVDDELPPLEIPDL